MNADTVGAKTINGILWASTTKAVGQVVTWAITLAVLRLLGPQDYGVMSMALLVTSFVLLFNELGLGSALIQAPDLNEDQVSDLRWTILGVNGVLFALVCLCAPLVSLYFHEPQLVSVVRVLSLSFVISGIGAASMFMLFREMSFKRTSQAELLGNLAGGVLTLALASAGFGTWSLVFGYLIQQAVINTLYCIFAPIGIRRTFRPANVTRFMKFGFQVAGARVLWWISLNADFAVVGRMLGKTQLGILRPGIPVRLAAHR